MIEAGALKCEKKTVYGNFALDFACDGIVSGMAPFNCLTSKNPAESFNVSVNVLDIKMLYV